MLGMKCWWTKVREVVLTMRQDPNHAGPQMGRPRVDTLTGSRHANMKELRFDAAAGVWRFAFAFDTARKAIILCGGDKSGGSQRRFYRQFDREGGSAVRWPSGRIEGRRREGPSEEEGAKAMNNIDRLRKGLSAERKRKIAARAATIIAEERSLQELRRAHKLTQKKMAEVLGVGQDSVSRLEQRSDLLISTLRGYVEAMGGKLSLVAEFPDQEPVILTGLAALD
jgi:DNA-binding XRE family transcriptional regulator